MWLIFISFYVVCVLFRYSFLSVREILNRIHIEWEGPVALGKKVKECGNTHELYCIVLYCCVFGCIVLFCLEWYCIVFVFVLCCVIVCSVTRCCLHAYHKRGEEFRSPFA
jgi:hypothetical protein